MTIFKYELRPIDEQMVQMPAGAKVLSAHEQHGGVCVWALVDPDKPLASVRFRVLGTGHEFENPEAWKFVDTVKLMGGNLMFHVFVAT